MTYYDEVIADSPSAYWRMGEDSGTNLADEIGSLDLTLSGGYTQNVAGAINASGEDDGAVDFDGSSGKAQHANGSGEFDAIITSGIFAIEFWFFIDTEQAATFIGMRTGTGSTTCRLSIHPRTGPFNGFQIRGGSTITQFTGSTITNGAWHHAVFNYNTGTWNIYIDSLFYTSGSRAISTSATLRPFVVGISNDSGNGINGKMDEVAIYDHELSESRIQDHYLASKEYIEMAPESTITFTSEMDLDLVIYVSLEPETSIEAIGDNLDLRLDSLLGSITSSISFTTSISALDEESMALTGSISFSAMASLDVEIPVEPLPSSVNHRPVKTVSFVMPTPTIGSKGRPE